MNQPHRSNQRQEEARSDSTVWDAARLADPHGQADKAERVRRMFDQIAGTYEWVNRLASLGRDASWRRRAVRLSGASSGDRVLDVACGTGDLARAIAQRAEAVVGVDFSEKMLALAANRPHDRIAWCRADALCLPFADRTFNMALCAFGVRNFQDLGTGLREMFRTLRPGGRAVILEFGMPTRRVFRSLYRVYFQRVMPFLATLISRDRTNAYRYLARSVTAFVGRDEMVRCLRLAGFETVQVFPFTFGIVSAYVAVKGL